MISVIVPVYNAEKTLTICVQSILAQTYKDWELILIDDGSTDRSGQICEELQEKCLTQNRPCRVVYQENRGVSAARNRGMELAAGEYFVCIDSDDRIEPCYLEDLVQTAEAHPEFGHVICGFKSISNHHKYVFSEREALTTVSRRDYMRLFEEVLIQSPCLALYQSNIVRDHHLKMRTDLSLGEDLLFNLTYLDALGDILIGVINKPNYIYIDEAQTSLNRKYRNNLLSILEMIDQSLACYLEKWNITDDKSMQLYDNAVFYNYLSVLNNTFHKDSPMSLTEKISFNSGLLKKEKFRTALQKSSVVMSPDLRRAMESGNYWRVLYVERIQKLKQFVMTLLRR